MSDTTPKENAAKPAGDEESVAQSVDTLETSNECPICYDPLSDSSSPCCSFNVIGPVLRISSCQHMIHNKCMEKWVSAEGKSTCPICRGKIYLMELGSWNDSTRSFKGLATWYRLDQEGSMTIQRPRYILTSDSGNGLTWKYGDQS